MAEPLIRVINEREADCEALLRGGIREPFCHTVPVSVERELFGIEQGVATRGDSRIGKFGSAQGCTLFLKELADSSVSAQAMVLLVLQEHAGERVGGHRAHTNQCVCHRHHKQKPFEKPGLTRERSRSSIWDEATCGLGVRPTGS